MVHPIPLRRQSKVLYRLKTALSSDNKIIHIVKCRYLSEIYYFVDITEIISSKTALLKVVGMHAGM